MKTCKKCGKLKNKSEFRSYITKINRKCYDTNCLACSAKIEAKAEAMKKKVKKEVIPIFVSASLALKDDKHIVQAIIRNGLKLHRYEESFDSVEQAQHMIEKINADPKIAVKFLDKSKPANYKAVNKNLR